MARISCRIICRFWSLICLETFRAALSCESLSLKSAVLTACAARVLGSQLRYRFSLQSSQHIVHIQHPLAQPTHAQRAPTLFFLGFLQHFENNRIMPRFRAPAVLPAHLSSQHREQRQGVALLWKGARPVPPSEGTAGACRPTHADCCAWLRQTIRLLPVHPFFSIRRFPRPSVV